MDSPLKQIEERERRQAFTGAAVTVFFLVLTAAILGVYFLR